MEKILKLAPNLKIPVNEYASQGNSILGIRDGGKTYTAMKAAEQLMDNGIPIIVYDPVGVWKNLKIGIHGHNGYDIVVAGGGEDCDITLTTQNAVQIVTMAMKEGVSLVMDLYSPALANKSSWIKIVQETVDVLMYQNKDYPLRHIFIEEAAEFIPQRLQPTQYKVYASIERLARMGRNARLGYTLINQRAEEVNKAILEITAFSLLHKQVGKNSLKSIENWMKLRQVENTGAIIKSLPHLQQGECWAIGIGNDEPHMVKISERNTFHPDPKKGGGAITGHMCKPSGNVSAFIVKMKQELATPGATVKGEGAAKGISVPDGRVEALQQENKELKTQLNTAKSEAVQLKLHIKDMDKWFVALQKHLQLVPSSVNLLQQAPAADYKKEYLQKISQSTKALDSALDKLPVNTRVQQDNKSGLYRMLVAAAMYHPNPVTKYRMAAIAGLSHSSGSFKTYLSTLKRNGHITTDGSNYTISDEGLNQVGDYEPVPTNAKSIVDMWCGIIGEGNGAARIFRHLAKIYPNSISKSELGEVAGMSSGSGSFKTYLSTLKRYNLITVTSGQCKAAVEIFEK